MAVTNLPDTPNPYATSPPAPGREPIFAAGESPPPDHAAPEMGRDPSRGRRVWTVALMVVVALPVLVIVSNIAMLAVAMVQNGFSRSPTMDDLMAVPKSRIGFLATMVLPQFLMLVPVVLAVCLSPVPWAERLGLRRGHWPLWAWISAAVATPIVAMISGLLVSATMPESENLKVAAEIFRAVGAGWFGIVVAISIGLTPAICEELLFRGYIQTRLTGRWMPAVGIVISSVLFAAYHMDPIHAVSVLPLGLFLGTVAYRANSIGPAMLGHFVNNFFASCVMVFGPDQDAAAAADMRDPMMILFALSLIAVLGLGLLGSAGTVYAMIRYRPTLVTP